MGIRKENDILSIALLQDSKENLKIKSIVEGLNNTYNIGSAIKNIAKEIINKTETFAANKHFEAQRRFTSTKRKKNCRLKIETKKKLKALEKDKRLCCI